MKILPKVAMILSIVFFALTVAGIVMKSSVLIIVFLALHSLCIIGFTYLVITYKDPDLDSQRLQNSLQQANAKFEEYRAETAKTLALKEETISTLCTELEAFKKGK